MSVEIVNKTTVPVKISEGSGGVFRLMGLIDPEKTFLLKVDKNSTYREYLLTTEPENLPVGSSLTSDDVADYSKIEIKETDTRRDDPVWNGIPPMKRRGVTRWSRDQPVAQVPIVNKLPDRRVKIVVKNEVADQTTDETIADLAPGDTSQLPMDPDHYYQLTASLRNGQARLVRRATHNTDELPARESWVSSDDLTKFSKIEIAYMVKYDWKGTTSAHRGHASQ